jgi:tripartite-type tricarboxylate transporter receptor subunit TctC
VVRDIIAASTRIVPLIHGGASIDKLNREINAALADPKLKARLADLGGTVLPGSPTDFSKLIAEETEKWGEVVRAANVKVE